MKPGFKTTEFWAVVALFALTALVHSGAFPDQHYAVKVAMWVADAVAAFGYGAQRAKLKEAFAAKRTKK